MRSNGCLAVRRSFWVTFGCCCLQAPCTAWDPCRSATTTTRTAATAVAQPVRRRPGFGLGSRQPLDVTGRDWLVLQASWIWAGLRGPFALRQSHAKLLPSEKVCLQTCLNGIIDPGEDCDDANTAARPATVLAPRLPLWHGSRGLCKM